MANVVVYTTPFCGYCAAAKRLLTRKGIAFEEVDVAYAPEKRAEMLQKSNGRRTVPQIFIGESHVGGSDELHALDREGRLDELLAAA